jgi:hypothetical protein
VKPKLKPCRNRSPLSVVAAVLAWLRPEVATLLAAGAASTAAKTAGVCASLRGIEAGLYTFASVEGVEPTNFRGGARAAVGDATGDGRSEIVVSAGFGGGPRVTVWDGARLLAGGPVGASVANFFAFEPGLRNGTYVAAGDATGDGRADLIFGAGPGGGPRVRIFDGPGLLGATFTSVDEIPGLQLANFFGGDANNRGGIRVNVKNLDGDDRADPIVGSGSGGGSRVTAYAGKDITPNGTPPALKDFDALPGFAGGVFVG